MAFFDDEDDEGNPLEPEADLSINISPEDLDDLHNVHQHFENERQNLERERAQNLFDRYGEDYEDRMRRLNDEAKKEFDKPEFPGAPWRKPYPNTAVDIPGFGMGRGEGHSLEPWQGSKSHWLKAKPVIGEDQETINHELGVPRRSLSSTGPGPRLTWDSIGEMHPEIYGDPEVHGDSADGADGEGIGWAAAHLAYDRPGHGDDDRDEGSWDLDFYKKDVPVSQIDYARHGAGDSRVERARRWYRSGVDNVVPPVLVHRHGVYQVADGHHRGEAAALEGLKTIPAYVAQSPHEDEPFEEGHTGPFHGAVRHEAAVVPGDTSHGLGSGHVAPREGPTFDDPEDYLPDVYDHPEYYVGSRDKRDPLQFASGIENWLALKKARGNPDALVDIYRAVPHGITEIEGNTNPRGASWVSASPSYAKRHAEAESCPSCGGDMQVIHGVARAGDLHNEGYLQEWGYTGDPIKDDSALTECPEGAYEARKAAEAEFMKRQGAESDSLAWLGFKPYTPEPVAPRVHQPEPIDDHEYSLNEVSRHYPWEGFDKYEIEHLVHNPEKARFTLENVPLDSLRHLNEHGDLIRPPDYEDIASQGEEDEDDGERERLEELERGYNQGANIPPAVVVRDGPHHIIADGSHRAAVYERMGETHMPAFVTQRTIPSMRHEAAAPNPYRPGLEVQEYDGEPGNPAHITRVERGMIPTGWVANMLGARGERPGEHRNRQGQDWEDFKNALTTAGDSGIHAPIFITVDYGKQPQLAEGNHRRDAYVELGAPHVPAEIRYFGHSERQGTVGERAEDRMRHMSGVWAEDPEPTGPGQELEMPESHKAWFAAKGWTPREEPLNGETFAPHFTKMMPSGVRHSLFWDGARAFQRGEPVYQLESTVTDRAKSWRNVHADKEPIFETNDPAAILRKAKDNEKEWLTGQRSGPGVMDFMKPDNQEYDNRFLVQPFNDSPANTIGQGEFVEPKEKLHPLWRGGPGGRSGLQRLNSAIPVGRDDDDAYLRQEFGVDPYTGDQTGGPQEIHPKSGYPVSVGLHRRLFIPKEGEAPAELVVDDHGPLGGFGMPKYDVAREPITHVYRGMSTSEVDQALKQGHIKSDQRGTIADWEGTNAGLDPATARSYLSTSEPSVIAKIRVQPEDGWFAIPHDNYVRTRQPIPIDRIEAISKPYHYEPDPESRYGRTRLMREAAVDESGLKAAGIAVIALDTGRVLMQQRALNPLHCPCGLGVTWDPMNGYQHDDGSISHDGEFYGQSVSDLLDQGHPDPVPCPCCNGTGDDLEGSECAACDGSGSDPHGSLCDPPCRDPESMDSESDSGADQGFSNYNDLEGSDTSGFDKTAALEFDPNEGTWEFPGGKIDPGELPRDAAIREFKEEVGQPLPPGVFVGAWVSPGGISVTAAPGKVDPQYLREFHNYLDREVSYSPEEFAGLSPQDQQDLVDSFGDYIGEDHPRDARYHLDIGDAGKQKVRTATPGRTVRVLRIEKPNGQGPFGYNVTDDLMPHPYGDESHDVPYTLMNPLHFDDEPRGPDEYEVRQRQPYADKIPARYVRGRVFGFLPQHHVGDYFNPHTLRGLHDLGYGVSQYDVPGEHVLLGRTQVAWEPEHATQVSHTAIPEHFDLDNMRRSAAWFVYEGNAADPIVDGADPRATDPNDMQYGIDGVCPVPGRGGDQTYANGQPPVPGQQMPRVAMPLPGDDEFADSIPHGQPNSSRNTKIQDEMGYPVLRKNMYSIKGADNEVFGSLVHRAIGSNAARVVHDVEGDPNVVMVQMADNLSPAGGYVEHSLPWGTGLRKPKSAATPSGIMTGLGDLLTRERDSNFNNWGILPDGTPYRYDFEQTQHSPDRSAEITENALGEPVHWSDNVHSDFAHHFTDGPKEDKFQPLSDNPLHPEHDVPRITAALQALRPDYLAHDRKDWHDELMRRWGEVAPHAKGTKSVLENIVLPHERVLDPRYAAKKGPVYKGFIYLIQRERDIDLGNREIANPDDPDGDMTEQSAWWEIGHAKKNPALRQECKKGTPWDELELWADKSVRENKQVKEALAKLSALPSDEQGWRDQFEALTDPLAEEGHGKDNSMWQHVQETLNDPEATDEQRDTARKLNDAYSEVDRRAQESAQWGRNNPGRVALFESNGFKFNPDSGRVRFEKTDENGWAHAIEPNDRDGHYGTAEDSGVGWRVTANSPESFHGLGPDLRPIGGGKSRVLTAVTGAGADDDQLALQLHGHNLEHSDFITHGWEPTRSAGEYLKKEDGAQHVAFPNRRTEAVPGYSPIIHERPGWNVNTTTFANPGDRVGKTTQTQYPTHLDAIIAHHPGTGMPHEAAEKCSYCKSPSVKTIVHSEGMGKIPVCAKHVGKGKEDAANCTPDGSRDPSNIDSVKTASGFNYPTGFPEGYVDPRPKLPEGLRYHDAPDQPYQSVGNEDFWRFQDPTLIPPLNEAAPRGYQIGQNISHPRSVDVQPMVVSKPDSEYQDEEAFDAANALSSPRGSKTEVKWNDPICENCYLRHGDIIPEWRHNTAMRKYYDDLGEEKHEFNPINPEFVHGKLKEARVAMPLTQDEPVVTGTEGSGEGSLNRKVTLPSGDWLAKTPGMLPTNDYEEDEFEYPDPEDVEYRHHLAANIANMEEFASRFGRAISDPNGEALTPEAVVGKKASDPGPTVYVRRYPEYRDMQDGWLDHDDLEHHINSNRGQQMGYLHSVLGDSDKLDHNNMLLLGDPMETDSEKIRKMPTVSIDHTQSTLPAYAESMKNGDSFLRYFNANNELSPYADRHFLGRKRSGLATPRKENPLAPGDTERAVAAAETMRPWAKERGIEHWVDAAQDRMRGLGEHAAGTASMFPYQMAHEQPMEHVAAEDKGEPWWKVNEPEPEPDWVKEHNPESAIPEHANPERQLPWWATA